MNQIIDLRKVKTSEFKQACREAVRERGIDNCVLESGITPGELTFGVIDLFYQIKKVLGSNRNYNSCRRLEEQRDICGGWVSDPPQGYWGIKSLPNAEWFNEYSGDWAGKRKPAIVKRRKMVYKIFGEHFYLPSRKLNKKEVIMSDFVLTTRHVMRYNYFPDITYEYSSASDPFICGRAKDGRPFVILYWNTKHVDWPLGDWGARDSH